MTQPTTEERLRRALVAAASIVAAAPPRPLQPPVDPYELGPEATPSPSRTRVGARTAVVVAVGAATGVVVGLIHPI
jgi:uncharacterized membrane protein YccC